LSPWGIAPQSASFDAWAFGALIVMRKIISTDSNLTVASILKAALAGHVGLTLVKAR
jgi:hypothetical protein